MPPYRQAACFGCDTFSLHASCEHGCAEDKLLWPLPNCLKPTIVGPARKRVCGTQATAPRAPLFVGSSALRALLAQLELEHLYSILCLQGSRSTSPLSGFACHEGILPRHPGRCSFTTPSSMQTARAGLRIFLVSCDASVLLSILWCCQSIFLRRSSMSRPRRPFNQRSSCLS